MTSDGRSDGGSFILRLIEAPVFHGLYVVLFAAFGIVVESHPAVATYGLYFLALISLLLFGAILRRRRIEKLAGTVYRRGENAALADIKQDLEAMPPGSIVTVCGTGVTAIHKLIPELYEAMRRGVNFQVYMLHPCDEITLRLADVERDFNSEVLVPLKMALKTSESVRHYLEPDWCDVAAKVLDRDEVCERHGDRQAEPCAPHPRVICTTADMWKQLEHRVDRTAPGKPHGHLDVRGYHMLPLVKAWRFECPDEPRWYYFADQVYHTGVGTNNPMRRVVANRPPGHEGGEASEDLMVPDVERLDQHLEVISQKSEPL